MEGLKAVSIGESPASVALMVDGAMDTLVVVVVAAAVAADEVRRWWLLNDGG